MLKFLRQPRQGHSSIAECRDNLVGSKTRASPSLGVVISCAVVSAFDAWFASVDAASFSWGRFILGSRAWAKPKRATPADKLLAKIILDKVNVERINTNVLWIKNLTIWNLCWYAITVLLLVFCNVIEKINVQQLCARTTTDPGLESKITGAKVAVFTIHCANNGYNGFRFVNNLIHLSSEHVPSWDCCIQLGIDELMFYLIDIGQA